ITKSSDLRPSLDLDAAPIDAFDGNAGAWGASFLDELEKAYPRTLWYSDASHALKLSEMFGRWAWIAFYGANDGGFHPLDLANFPVGVLAQQYTSVGVIGSTFRGDVSRLRHGRPARLLARR